MPGSKTAAAAAGNRCLRTWARSPQPTVAQQARSTLNRVRFAAGIPIAAVELSPRLSRRQRRELAFWIRRIPPALQARLPRLKVAVAERLHVVRSSLFINETPLNRRSQSRSSIHAASYIPQQYLVLHAKLFRQRIEVGRILYHELCHFLWPRLGNPRRERFASLLLREFRQRVRGELGYSAEWRKHRLAATATPRWPDGLGRRWRQYVCESFCDTGSFVLLGRERRTSHSEYTLGRAARQRRERLWWELILGEGAGRRAS